ncbi:HEAT repeat domain-containing protein [Treponema sp.]
MNVAKRILALAVAIAAVSTVAIAQTNGAKPEAKQELSVEESYLQESVETMIIKEQSRADSREMKLVALEYIGEAIDSGRAGEDIQKALEYMGMEGVVNKAREGGMGRVTNNYPDVRAKVAKHLGDLGGEGSQKVLMRMVLVDPEPMVLTEAVKSLAKIGLNENDETVSTISWIVTRFDIINPDNLLALAALDAYEKIAEKNGGIKDPSTIRTIIRISEGNYIRPVQQRARDVLSKLRKYNTQNSKDNSKK